MPARSPLTIDTVLTCDDAFTAGHGTPMNDLLVTGGRCLDDAGLACGILFRGSDGRFYAGTFAFSIEPAAAAFVRDHLHADGCRCDNCCGVFTSSDLNPVKDRDERMDPGGSEPAGECPACGALAYPLSLAEARRIAAAGCRPGRKRRDRGRTR